MELFSITGGAHRFIARAAVCKAAKVRAAAALGIRWVWRAALAGATGIAICGGTTFGADPEPVEHGRIFFVIGEGVDAKFVGLASLMIIASTNFGADPTLGSRSLPGRTKKPGLALVFMSAGLA